jgi:hypothetical protein
MVLDLSDTALRVILCEPNLKYDIFVAAHGQRKA